MASKGLVWFRNDLRVSDNPALSQAIEDCDAVLAVYILEDGPKPRPLGAAARAWLRESLRSLATSLARRGIPLLYREGSASGIIDTLVREEKIAAVYWNRRYDPDGRKIDTGIKSGLRDRDLTAESFNASLLAEPWTIATKSGTPFAVFTPFWKALREKTIDPPVSLPRGNRQIKAPDLDLGAHPDWAKKVLVHWTIGEDAAHHALETFLDERLGNYSGGRDVPGTSHTSHLSPHLRFGEIGPRRIWHATRHLMDRKPSMAGAGGKFLSELAWREFSYHLLYHRDDIAKTPMQERFKQVHWRTDSTALKAWQKGMTGIPMVDAGMRQLWETGWMHNRVRMLTASLLSKNLLIDWRKGEQWFWDTLVDADPANNPASWQWVAGCGADAAPYFRIFNPATQGKKFDPEGVYVRRWVPEIETLSDADIHSPWEAKADRLDEAGVTLGQTYPEPIVDLKASRKRALDALSSND